MRALIDPRLDDRDLRRREGAVERHGRLFEPRDPAVETAVFGAPGHDRGAVVAALHRAVARPQVEARGLEVAVARLTGRLEDRADVALERDKVRGKALRRHRASHRDTPDAHRRHDTDVSGHAPSLRRPGSRPGPSYA